METAEVTIGIVNYNGKDDLPQTLDALQTLHYPVHEIIVVDNNSTDGSREWLQEQHSINPTVRCIALSENLGPAGGRNVIIQQATTDYIFTMDNDITLEPDTLDHLMHVLTSTSQVGVCHPEFQDDSDPGVHHYNGGWIHYLCTLIAREMPDSNHIRPFYEQFDVIGGAALLMRRQVVLEIGGFDPDYFFNWEDGDFTARLTLAGYKCLNVPNAIVHHRSKPRGTSKVFYQVRNRWYFILKLYSWRTLVLIAPMLLLFELLQAAFLLKKGAFRDYWRGSLAAIKDIPIIMAKRREFQKLKKIRDREWLRSGKMYVPPQLNQQNAMLDKLQRAFYRLCDFYWRLVGPLC